MGWWFGRKSAPADVRPFVPAWLSTAEADAGFARSLEGMIVYVRSSAVPATFRDGEWVIGPLNVSALTVAGKQIVGARTAAIAAPAGGATIDAECRGAIAQVLSALRQHGLIET